MCKTLLSFLSLPQKPSPRDHQSPAAAQAAATNAAAEPSPADGSCHAEPQIAAPVATTAVPVQKPVVQGFGHAFGASSTSAVQGGKLSGHQGSIFGTARRPEPQDDRLQKQQSQVGGQNITEVSASTPDAQTIGGNRRVDC